MKVRRAKNEDIEQIYSLFGELFTEETRGAGKVAKFLKDLRKKKNGFEKSAKKELLREIKERNSRYLVVEENGILLGYGYASVHKTKDPFFNPKVIGYLNSIVVSKKLRGKGIASTLHAEISKWFKEKKCDAIYLEVFVTNTAVKLYEKWGYKTSTCKMWKKGA